MVHAFQAQSLVEFIIIVITCTSERLCTAGAECISSEGAPKKEALPEFSLYGLPNTHQTAHTCAAYLHPSPEALRDSRVAPASARDSSLSHVRVNHRVQRAGRTPCFNNMDGTRKQHSSDALDNEFAGFKCEGRLARDDAQLQVTRVSLPCSGYEIWGIGCHRTADGTLGYPLFFQH